ncbi:MAG: endonuclease domain-containing protein [Thermodesulfovibrionales bacterium]
MQKTTKESNRCGERLWTLLRNRQLDGVEFRRQFSIGRYILDFYSPEYGLGIEADGGQHYEDKGIQRDRFRTRELKKFGVEILRFSDREILANIEGVYEIIKRAIDEKRGNPPHLNPLPLGRGGKGVKKLGKKANF